MLREYPSTPARSVGYAQRTAPSFPILGLVVTLAVLAQQAATEAPAGFDTPTLATNQGSQSTSSGIPEPAGDTFALDQKVFETKHDASTRLGPVFSASSCAGKHDFGSLHH
jgi:hypothetical protein